MSEIIGATSWKRRLATMGVGWITNKGQVVAFDYLLYPLVMWQLGLVWGAMVMSVLSFVVSLLLIFLYDYLKTDWLGFEMIKEERETEKPGRWHSFLRSALRKSNLVALVALSIWQDPFFTVAYMRHGAHAYNGLSRRDWKIFVASWLISNGYWIFLIFSGMSLVRWVWAKVS